MKIAMIGHKRIPTREGGIEIVVAELSKRLAALGNEVTAYNRKSRHIAGKTYNAERQKNYEGVRLKWIYTPESAKLNALVYSFFATLAAVLPAFVIVLVLMKVMKTAAKNKGVEAAVNGLKPCIVGIILATGIYMAGKNILPQTVIDLKALVLTAVLASIYFGSKKVWKEGISPIVLILISGTVGILLYGIGV
jgi:hypothetical protein